jgi:hypothetical protein
MNVSLNDYNIVWNVVLNDEPDFQLKIKVEHLDDPETTEREEPEKMKSKKTEVK